MRQEIKFRIRFKEFKHMWELANMLEKRFKVRLNKRNCILDDKDLMQIFYVVLNSNIVFFKERVNFKST